MHLKVKLSYLSRIYRERVGWALKFVQAYLTNKYLPYVNANAMHTSQHKFIPDLPPL